MDALSAGLIPEFVIAHDAALAQAGEGERLRSVLMDAECDVFRAAPELVNDASDTTTPQGVLAVIRQVELPLPDSPTFVLVCDGVKDVRRRYHALIPPYNPVHVPPMPLILLAWLPSARTAG